MGGDGEGFGRASRLSAALVMGFRLLIEGLLQAMDALPVVARSSLATTGDAESTAEAWVVPEPGEERSEVVAIFEKEAGAAVVDEGSQTADAAGDDRFARAPGFEDDDAEGLMHGGEDKDVASLVGIKQGRVVMTEAGQKVDAILQAELGDAAAQGGGVIGLGLGADHDQMSG